jgi:branched-chain amino acid transport system ATP-binding protein
MSLLSVKDVSVRFGGIRALDEVSLDLNRGEILGLIGPNGAGKTTLFNCISGVLEPDQGRIRFDGRTLRLLKPHQRAQRGIARTFQNLQLWSSMTVLDNVKVPIDALGKRNLLSDALGLPYSVHTERAATERARAILHVLELLKHEQTLAGDLPVGIQRRVELARALAMRPQLLLLDEPAAGLDAEETGHLADLLTLIRERFKVSMLLVDHDMSLVMRACHYIYVMDFGKVLARGRPEEIRRDPKVIAAYLGEAAEEPAPPEEVAPITIEPAPEEAPADRVEISHGFDSLGAPLLDVKGLAAGYGPIEVIRDVNFYVMPGEVVACIGANGAGKTTTLRAISGVLRPKAGRVVLDGEDVTGKRPEQVVRRRMIHIPQGRGIFPKLSVEDTLRLAAYSGHKGNGRSDDDFEPAFQVFPRLKERRRQLVGTLSGGEQQMVAMARALLVRPKLVLIDEMSQGLAPTVVHELFRLLKAFRSHGIAVFLVEQFVDSALAVADRAYVFEQGSIAHEGTAAELRRDKALIAASYLGAAPDAADRNESRNAPAKAGSRNGHKNGNGHAPLPPELLEILAVRLPAEVIRSLQERATATGVPTSKVVQELLGGSSQ